MDGSGPRVSSPQDVLSVVGKDLWEGGRERVEVLMLDAGCRLLAREVLSEGDGVSAPFHPRAVFQVALRYPTVFIILVHNHPHGCPEPSEEDLEVTRKIEKIGRMLGVYLMDHLIVGRERTLSLRALGLLSKFPYRISKNF